MSDNEIDPNETLADEWAAALEQQETTDPDEIMAEQAAESAQLQELQDDAGEPAAGDVQLDSILDVPITISMEIGRTQIPIRNLLQLNQGSVVELDRLAGEPMDVLVNGTLIAPGEVVG